MKEFLTEWLINHGRSWSRGDDWATAGAPAWEKAWDAVRANHMQCDTTSGFRINDVGLEYLKNERISD